MKVAVTGGTGLIGNKLLEILSADEEVDQIISIARREGSKIQKVRWVQADLNSDSELKEAVSGCEISLCALGTTMKKAGSKEAFENVDFSFVLNFAKASKHEGINRFGVVSAIGSDTNSSVFYNQVKGKMEEGLKNLSFEHLIIAQPSILVGDRKENRLGERIGIAVMSTLSPLMVGSLKKYRPIKAAMVARGLWSATKNGSKKVSVLSYEELNQS